VSVPSEDLERFSKSIADFVEKMTTYAGSATDPDECGKLIAARLCPNTRLRSRREATLENDVRFSQRSRKFHLSLNLAATSFVSHDFPTAKSCLATVTT
jgi:hypothetical protein